MNFEDVTVIGQH